MPCGRGRTMGKSTAANPQAKSGLSGQPAHSVSRPKAPLIRASLECLQATTLATNRLLRIVGEWRQARIAPFARAVHTVDRYSCLWRTQRSI